MDLTQLESIVLTNLKNKVKDRIKEKYPNFTITTSDKKPATMNYPYVYVHQTNTSEVGQDLENETINGLNTTFQVDVYSDTSQEVTDEIMLEIMRVMKNMRFSIAMFPENQNSDVLYRKIARFTRIVGGGDIF